MDARLRVVARSRKIRVLVSERDVGPPAVPLEGMRGPHDVGVREVVAPAGTVEQAEPARVLAEDVDGCLPEP